MTVATFVIGAAMLALALRGSGVTRIPDVSSPFHKVFKDRIHTLASGALAIHIKGEVNGSALLHTSYGDIQIVSGKVDKILIGPEYWGPTCDVKYEPITANRGELTLRVGLGSDASWARYPLMDVLPEDYVGGWTTWYPDRTHKYASGGMFRGRKRGLWTYWDGNGNIIRVEDWQNGVQMPSVVQ